ncbi:MAG: hypothetical protein K6G61_00825 [Solobacterium sp.]|nr:hypothetical protein [Solobacterium sp.]
MDIERTRRYYERLTDEDICSCAYCRNYVRNARSFCTALAAYLDELGADIEKPFEAIPVGPADGMMYYSGVQYVIMGSAGDFRETSVGDARVCIADSHPMTDITGDHFVIEVSPVSLKWTGE